MGIETRLTLTTGKFVVRSASLTFGLREADIFLGRKMLRPWTEHSPVSISLYKDSRSARKSEEMSKLLLSEWDI